MAEAVAVPQRSVGRGVESRQVRKLPFEFHGSGFEFFRIWIVNILLSIVTLGIYSAWAKVRTQRYFYGNTQLAGSSFDYLASPLTILKGRLIAFACLMAYSVAAQLSATLSLVALGVFLVAMPWMVVRGLSFRNQNSAWRGVRFGFDGGYGGAVMAFVVWPLLGVLSLGLLVPLAVHRQQRFIVENSRYGTAPFMLKVGVGPFYLTCLVILAGAIAGGVLGLLLGTAVPLLTPVLLAVGYLLLFAYTSVSLTNLIYGNLQLGANHLQSRYHLGSYLLLMLGNLLGLVLTLGVFYPWAKVRNARYAAEHMGVLAGADLDAFVAAQERAVSSLGGEMGEMFDVGVGL